MKLNHTLTALVAAGLLNLMAAPVMARDTTGPFDAAVEKSPPLVLAQETPAQARHEEQRYQEQMREDKHQAVAMRHDKHRYKHGHHKHYTHSDAKDNANNGHDMH
jgi:hypothetical protein